MTGEMEHHVAYPLYEFLVVIWDSGSVASNALYSTSEALYLILCLKRAPKPKLVQITAAEMLIRLDI